ncbi:MAG TPA: hypothetical protein VN956_01150 [Pyrinomonadaceae bacterium]|nr:hypothetical protein [Pyrinomonadaceae bacterium]
MRLKNLGSLGCVLLAVLTISAQANAPQTDPISGNWGADGNTLLELNYDGKGSVSGTTHWGSADNSSPIKTGTFDPKTNALKLEGEAKRPDGTTVQYVIEGKLNKDTLSGTYRFGNDKGDFTFKKTY